MEWIWCSHKKPEAGQMVIGYLNPLYDDSCIEVVLYKGDDFIDVNGRTVRVSHWIPLPEPPR